MKDNNYSLEQKRGSWGTRFGFLISLWFASAGIGNIWRFPWKTASMGGGAFVLPYLVFILILSLPAVMGEGIIGKYAQGGPIASFRKIGGSLRGLGMSIIILNMFVAYSILIAGQSLAYTFFSATGAAMRDPEGLWNGFVGNTPLMVMLFIGIVLLSTIPPYLGISGGVEKVGKFMGVACIIMLVIAAVRGVTLPGAWEGVVYYLNPDWSRMFKIDTLANAMGQAYFSFGPGWAWFLTLSSYAKLHEDTGRAQLTTGLADTSIALLAGFAVIPTLFASGLGVGMGSKSSFVALPIIFNHLPMGTFFCTMFFLAFFFAAYTCEYVLVDVVGSFFVDYFGWKRKKAIVASGIVLIIAGIWPTINGQVFATFDTLFGLYFLPMAVTLQSIAAAHVFSAERFRKTVMNPYGNGYIGTWWELLYKWVVPSLSMFLMIKWAIDMSASGAPWYLGWGGMVIIAAVLVGSMVIFGKLDEQKQKTLVSVGK